MAQVVRPTASGFPSAPPTTAASFGGDYELIEEIARGGMGVVWRARQRSLDRFVALKILRGGRSTSQDEIQRFKSEAVAVANLAHPGIVPIYEVGEDDGRWFYSMELVEGTDLARRIAAGPRLSPRQAASMVVEIAEAISHAHQRGVIHRDLKPANILLDQGGHPRVTDFGIAKLLEAGTEDSVSGFALGTPEYMAPEQAAGETRQITTATDVYGLGAILYALLSGHSPIPRHSGEPIHSFLLRIGVEDPLPPTSTRSTMDLELSTICLKCLEKNPARRYVGAWSLADDLNRWLRGEPIQARPVTRAEWFAKWARRNPMVAGLAIGCVLLAGSMLVGFAYYANHTGKLNQELGTALLRTRLQRAEDRISANDSTWAMAEFTRLARQFPTDRIVARRLVSALEKYRSIQPEIPVMVAGATLASARLSPDSRWILAMDGKEDVRVFDAITGSLRATHVGYGFFYDSLSFSGDGTKVATGLKDGRTFIWELSTGQLLTPPLVHQGSVEATDFSADGKRVATGSWDGTARVWDAETGVAITPSLRHAGKIRCVRFSPDGLRLATASSDGSARIWDTRTGAAVGEALRHSGRVDCVRFSPDGTRLLTASQDGTAQLWNAESGSPIGLSMRHSERVVLAEFSPDGHRIATASIDGSAGLWDLDSGTSRPILLRHRSEVRCLAFSPDGRFLATGSYDTTVRLWDARTGDLFGEPVPNSARLRSIEFDRTSRRLLTASEDGRVQVWRVSEPKLHTELLLAGNVREVDFCQNGTSLVTGSKGGIARVWDAKSGLPVTDPLPHGDEIYSLHFDRAGGRILTGAKDGIARLFEVPTGKRLMTFSHQTGRGVYSARFDRSERWIATASDDHTACLWDLKAGGGLHQTLKHPAPVVDVAFRPDSKWIATASDDGRARLWEISSGRMITDRFRHDFRVSTAFFSADGRWLVTAAFDKTVKIWDLESQSDHPESILRHNAGVRSAEISPDASRILTRCVDNSVCLWSRNSDGWVANHIHHEGDVAMCGFGPGGLEVVTACRDGSSRIWDADTGLLLCAPIHHSLGVGVAKLSPDRRTLFTASGEEAFLTRLPEISVPLPGWILDLAESLVGTRLDDADGIHKISADKYFEARAIVANSLLQDDLTQWGRTFFGVPTGPLADPANEPIAPSGPP